MTPTQFKAWRRRLGLSQDEAAAALDLSRTAIQQYEAGLRRDGRGAAVIPRTVELACAALAAGITAYVEPS